MCKLDSRVAVHNFGEMIICEQKYISWQRSVLNPTKSRGERTNRDVHTSSSGKKGFDTSSEQNKTSLLTMGKCSAVTLLAGKIIW